MVKNLAKFIFLFSLFSHTAYTSDDAPKDILTRLPKLVFSNVIEFTDIESVKRLHLTSKSLHNKILDLESHFKGVHPILDLSKVKLFETCILNFKEKNKEILGFDEKNKTMKVSMSPFCFPAYLIEKTKENEDLKCFVDEFMDTLLDKKYGLLNWQSMMIRKKIQKPFFEEIIKKTEKQSWGQVFENELLTTEKYTDSYHPYYVIVLAFFLDKGVPIDYNIENTLYSFKATALEVVAEKGFYNLCLFLLNNGAKVNNIIEKENLFLDSSCLYLAIVRYLELLKEEKNCDESCRTIFLLLDRGADKDFKLSWGKTVRQFVEKHVTEEKILKYFQN